MDILIKKKINVIVTDGHSLNDLKNIAFYCILKNLINFERMHN